MVWKTNINVDALLRVSWSECATNTIGLYHQITAATVQAVQETSLRSQVSPIEAYSCNLCILNTIKDNQQWTCMTTKDWQQAQLADPVLGEVIARMQDGTLGQYPIKLTNLVYIKQLLHKCNKLTLRKGIQRSKRYCQRNCRRPSSI